MKYYNTFITKLFALAALLMAGATASWAVDVTYSLTTHVDGRTMTQTASQTAGAKLSLPKEMMRGYTDYTYYEDEALTTAITTVPAEGGTVYVDYTFNAPFVMSDEDFPVSYVVGISYSSKGYNNLRESGVIKTLGTSGARHKFNFYGDSYCLWLQSASTNKYITWNNSDHAKRATQTSRPAMGWQMIKNTSTREYSSFSHFSLGTYEEGQNNGGYYIYRETNLDTDSDTSNENKKLTTTSTNTSSKDETSMYTFLTGQAPNTPYTITYRIIQDYPKYQQRTLVVTPMKNTVKVANPANETIKKALDAVKDNDLFTYTFYKDEAMTQQYGDDEYCEPNATKSVEATKNIVVWVKETYLEGHEMAYVTDRWITICLPYGVSDVEDYFGEDAVIVGKLSGVEVDGAKYNLQFEQVNKMEPNTPYMFKANNVLDGKYLTLYKTVAPPHDADATDEELHLSIDYEATNATVSMHGTFDGKTLTYDEDKYQFFVGYKTDDKSESPNFYRVTNKRDVEIQPFRCWFEIADMASDETGAPTLVFVTTGTDGIQTIVPADEMARTTHNVYNLNGQLVRVGSLQGLPKGIYIVNGKKVANK